MWRLRNLFAPGSAGAKALFIGVISLVGLFVIYWGFGQRWFRSPTPREESKVGDRCMSNFECAGVYRVCARNEGEEGFCTKNCRREPAVTNFALHPEQALEERGTNRRLSQEDCPPGWSCVALFSEIGNSRWVCAQDS